MKKNLFVYFGLFAALSLCACDKNETPTPTLEDNFQGLVLAKAEPESGFSFRVESSETTIHLHVSPNLNYVDKAYRDWQESMQPHCDKMYEQILANGWQKNSYGYPYAMLKSIELTADVDVAGIPAGEELIQLFELDIPIEFQPIFTYNDLNLALNLKVEEYKNGEYWPVAKFDSVEEFINGEYLMVKGIYLTPKAGVSIPEGVTYTATVTLSTGASQTATSK